MDITETIIRAKNGEKEAFSDLFNEYYDPLFRFAMSRTRDKDKSIDVCQEVFLRWYEALPRYELSGTSPLSYLFTIAIRLIINESVKKKYDYLSPDADEYISDESVNTESWGEIQISLEQIEALFEHLTEDEKLLIELKYISDLNNKEISEIVDKTPGAIRQIEHRALSKLRKLYQEKYERE